MTPMAMWRSGVDMAMADIMDTPATDIAVTMDIPDMVVIIGEDITIPTIGLIIEATFMAARGAAITAAGVMEDSDLVSVSKLAR
jgi:hypothetical protein